MGEYDFYSYKKDGNDRNKILLDYCASLGYKIKPQANPADFILTFAAAKSDKYVRKIMQNKIYLQFYLFYFLELNQF
jgi:hypothetical protein